MAVALREEIDVWRRNSWLHGTVAAMKEEMRAQKQELLQSSTAQKGKSDEVQLLQRELEKNRSRAGTGDPEEMERGQRQRDLVDEVSAPEEARRSGRELRNESRRDESIAQMRAKMAAERSQQELAQVGGSKGFTLRTELVGTTNATE